MNLILSDRPLALGALPADWEYVNLAERQIRSCIGCFGCWVKTPGRCVIRDDAPSVYPLIAASERVIYVSRIDLGSYDVVMKRMLERAIPIQQAFIRLHHGETHHVQRSVREKDALILAYGDIAEPSARLFERLVARNALNMNFRSWKVCFAPEEEMEQKVRKAVRQWNS